MTKSNKYRRYINGQTYYVHVFEFWIMTTVKVTGRLSYPDNVYAKKRKFFCDDVERFAATTLSQAVQTRENKIEESKKYDEKIEQALDVVEAEYDGE